MHQPESEQQVGRSRDAAGTRRLLLDAARHRFAHDGYATTTVRDIATDAGVNVALINRYFVSKEGLFEACLRRVGEDLGRPAQQGSTVEQILESMVVRLTDLPTGDYTLQLLLLLRSSGDERADEIRTNTLRSFSESIAAAAGWTPGTVDGDTLVLRAQIALAATLGIVLLRSTTRVEPLVSARADDLREPLAGVLAALLGSR